MFILGSIFFTPFYAFNDDNKELLTRSEGHIYLQLKDMLWKKKLTDEEILKVIANLAHEKSTIATVAIKVVSIHRIKKSLPQLERKFWKNYGHMRTLGNIITRALQSNKDAMVELHKVFLSFLLSGKFKNTLIIEELKSILIIEKAITLRYGKQFNLKIENSDLSRFHVLLLEYSKLKRNDAIQLIVKKRMGTFAAGNMGSPGFTEIFLQNFRFNPYCWKR